MAFAPHTTTYGRPTDPYERAARVWDDRIGAARVQAFHWRLAALLALTLALGLGAGLLHVAAHPDVRTYVVEIDSAGLPPRITLADSHYRPNAAQTGYFLAQLVRLVRARSLDPVVLRTNWSTAYRFLAGDALATMNAYARRDAEATQMLGQRVARTVQIGNVLAQSAHTYQVRWTETTYVAGVPQPPASYTGLFEVDYRPPQTEEEVFHNPLGVYVVSFTWSREFDAAVRTPTTAPTAESEPTHENRPQ